MKITVGEIEKLASDQAPPNNSTCVSKVMGEDFRTAMYKPWWTGWKGDIDEYCSNRSPFAVVDFPGGPIGYVGQWICYTGEVPGITVLSVNLPGMECDVTVSGRTFNIGTKRVYADTPPEELERMIEVGYAKLLEMIAAEKSKAA